MTRLLFLPNDQTFLLLESPLPAGAVIETIEAGQWTPPEPYGSLLSELKPPILLQTFQQGTLVVITTSRPPNSCFGVWSWPIRTYAKVCSRSRARSVVRFSDVSLVKGES